MNKTFKKTLSTLLSASMIAASVVLPTAASADAEPLVAGDTVLQEWKFDFGAEGQTPAEGFTAVAPDRNYVTAKDYGFLGIDEEAYKLSERIDSFGMQKGQQITLTAGGTGENDGIGSTGEDAYGNACDEFYPTRFALKADDETYYRVKATVTTLDATKPATVSLYTERKHPLFTDTALAAGETKTVLFTVRPTPIYYQKSNPQGSIADGMVNVCVLGENSALASLEIQKVSTAPVFWVLGDSTVTDGNCSLPFFKLQNYTGVGTGLTKYIPGTFAMVNEGEGGLNAADSLHFNMVSSRIKAGDYLYVEYGHNHKDDGPTGYTACLDKYYNLCHEKGAKLIIVSPIERINQWDSDTSKYTHSLRGFATAGEEYVAAKVTAGATDIAYVDLNEYSLNFYNKIVSDNGDSANAIKYYFQTAKGGGTDTTHPNDAGAENLAYEFIKAAKAVTDTTQKAVLAGILDTATAEVPTLVDISEVGSLAGDAWPTYIVPTDNEYPVVIRNIAFNEQGVPTSAKVTVQQAKINLSAYGIIVITIYNEDGTEKGKLYAVDQVDNSTGLGNQTITHFRGDVTLGENDTYTAIVMQAKDNAGGLVVDEEANQPYSSVYVPSEIVAHFITDEDGNGGEDFDFYGAAYTGDNVSSLIDFNGWKIAGSAHTKTLTLGETDDFKYTTVQTDGAKETNDTVAANQGSFILTKAFAQNEETSSIYDTGVTGKYIISADLKYLSGGGARFKLASGVDNKNAWGTQSLALFSVDADGKINASGQEMGQISAMSFTPVKYILDMDLGTAEVSVAGADPITIELSNYDTTELAVSPSSLNTFMIEADKNAVGIQMANLVVAKLKDEKLPKKLVGCKSSDNTMGTVAVTAADDDIMTEEQVPDGLSIGYSEGKATVNSDSAVNGTFIEAKYTGTQLSEIKPTAVTLGADGGTQTIDVTAGSKLMLWDTLSGMTPKLEAVTATGTIAPATKTAKVAPLNTVLTYTATPGEGYVFTGWSNGTSVVSTDNPYSFRLRDDITLTAQFTKQKGAESVASFNVKPDKTRMAVGTENKVNITLSDVLDANGNAVKYNAETDVAWTCAENGITVENGVVTIPADYTPDTFKKTVPVSCTINNITKNVNLVLYDCEMYEDFTDVNDFSTYISNSGTTNTLFGIVDTATDKTTFAGMSSVGNGKVLVMGNNGNGDKSKLAYEKDLGLSSYSTLKFGFDIEPHQIRTDGKNSSVTLQFVDSEGTKVFDISIATGGNVGAPANSSFNGTAVNGFVNGNVVSVDTEFDFAAKTMTYKLTNSAGTVLAQGTANITAKDLSKMSFEGTWQYGKFAIDNVYAEYEPAN